MLGTAKAQIGSEQQRRATARKRTVYLGWTQRRQRFAHRRKAKALL
jgi:hypothetical protein